DRMRDSPGCVRGRAATLVLAESLVRAGFAPPATSPLLHGLLVEQCGALQIHTDEDATRRRPRERDLLGIDGVAGEEACVLRAERGGGASDRRRTRDRRRPGSPIERVVGTHGAGAGGET